MKQNYFKKVTKLFFGFLAIMLLTSYLNGELAFSGASYADTPSPSNTTSNTPHTTVPISSCPKGESAPFSYADSVAIASPGVVSIKTTKEIPIEQNPLLQDPFFRHFFGDQGQGDFNNNYNRNERGDIPKEVQQGLGSGVIVSDKGYVLTNLHVIKEADTVVITLADGRTTDAKVIGVDQDTDLAILQIKLDKLPVIPIGSSQKLRVGDVVLAIGNPFGLDKTVTQGIVSATERAGADIGILENLIQTDAAINPGNSGGALIDACGRLVGINTAIYSRSGGYQGIGFAIPIDQATLIMNQLIEGKQIKRGFLGVTLETLNKEIRDSLEYKGEGVYVRAVVRGSPAQKAGILPGDIIVKINNEAVKDNRVAQRLVAMLTPGKNYSFEVYRKGDFLTFTIMLGERRQTPLPKKKEKETQRENLNQTQ